MEFTPPAKSAWRYQTEGPDPHLPGHRGGGAYVGSYDGWLYALDLATGRRVWRFPAEAAITGAPCVADDEIFFGTEARAKYSASPASGQKWPAHRATRLAL